MKEHIHGHEFAGLHSHWRHGPHARGRWGGRGPGQDWRGFFEGGRHGHGPGLWGHGGGRERLERGLLRYIILGVLSDGPKHGYEIIKHLEEHTGGRYSPSPGTLYPTLQYLEDLGLVRSTQQEDRRVYEITDNGKAELEEHKSHIKGFWGRFEERAPSGATLHEANFLKDAVGDLNRTVGGVRGAIMSGDQETVRRVRQALERCQNEIREIIAQGAQRQSQTGEGENSDQPGEPEGTVRF